MPSSLHRTIAALSVVTVGACQDVVAPIRPSAPEGSTVPTARADGIVSGRYLVRLRHRGADAPERLRARLRAAGTDAETLVVGDGRTLVATLGADDVARLRLDPDVAGIEPDRLVVGAGLQLGAPWALDRVDQPALPLGGTYVYSTSGASVTVYVLDTGVQVGHAEFGGRAEAGHDFVTAGGGAADCNGHGTHVAGLVGGATYGVAKGARVVAVRVLDCELKGTVSRSVAALGWVVAQKKARPATPVVANLSLVAAGGSAAFDAAVAEAIAAGVTVVAAAGNAGADACGSSPGRAPGVVTVAASDRSDAFAGFSNRGACVALAAPGVDVPSAGIGDARAWRWSSGTSAAAPVVAGAAALYLAAHPGAKPAQVRQALVAHAVPGALAGVPAGTANRLVNVEFLRDGRTLPAAEPLAGPHVGRRCAAWASEAVCTATVTPSL